MTYLSFWLLLVLTLLSVFIIKNVTEKRQEVITVPIVNYDVSLGMEMVETLTNAGIEGYRFWELKSEEELKKGVMEGDYLCGLVLSEELTELVTSEKYKNAITLYQRADSTEGMIVKEIVFPFILQLSADSLLTNYIRNSEPAMTDELLDRFLEKNHTEISGSSLELASIKMVDVPVRDSFDIRYIVILLVGLVVFVFNYVECIHENQEYRKITGRFVNFAMNLASAAIRTVMLAILTVVVALIFIR